MYGFILTIHILVCILLIVAVLLQSGKGSDMGAVFGGSGSQALFGSAGPADFLNKSTRVLVVIFMVTSLSLGYFAFEKPTQSIMETPAVTEPASPQELPAPVIPPAPATSTQE